ncbi:MAG: exodeoxyribonuclease VII small subunit [Bdellovibrionales bacterium]|nr:exodeoxyribonuclease VII small subunit [Bdellovibrionales bacterium]
MSQQSNQFEQSLQKLESIVKNLESGSLSLEDSLTAFQEGVGLVKQCQGMLSTAEQKVEMLVKASAEGVETRPFNPE